MVQGVLGRIRVEPVVLKGLWQAIL